MSDIEAAAKVAWETANPASVANGWTDAEREVWVDALTAALMTDAFRGARAALIKAADEVHTEARWQAEMSGRMFGAERAASAMKHDYAAERMLVVEQILRDSAAALAASSSPASPGTSAEGAK